MASLWEWHAKGNPRPPDRSRLASRRSRLERASSLGSPDPGGLGLDLRFAWARKKRRWSVQRLPNFGPIQTSCDTRADALPPDSSVSGGSGPDEVGLTGSPRRTPVQYFGGSCETSIPKGRSTLQTTTASHPWGAGSARDPAFDRPGVVIHSLCLPQDGQDFHSGQDRAEELLPSRSRLAGDKRRSPCRANGGPGRRDRPVGQCSSHLTGWGRSRHSSDSAAQGADRWSGLYQLPARWGHRPSAFRVLSSSCDEMRSRASRSKNESLLTVDEILGGFPNTISNPDLFTRTS